MPRSPGSSKILRKSKSFSFSIYLAHIFYGLSIASAPFYFGGERILSWGVSGCLQAFVFLFLIFLPRPQTERPRAERLLLQTALVLVGATLVWSGVQLIPLFQNEFAHPMWSIAHDIIDLDEYYPISVSPDESFLTLIKLVIVVMTFLNAVRLYSIYPHPRKLLWIIALSGTVYALIGLVWVQFFPNEHFWLKRSPYAPSVVSTHVNRNSFAEYMALCSICALVLAERQWQILPKAKTIFQFIQALLNTIFQRLSINLLLFAVMFVALLLTASRGGVLSAFAGYAAFGLILILRQRKLNIAFILSATIITSLIVAIYGLYSGLADARSASAHDALYDRLDLYHQVWDIILDRPLLGYGLGSFEPIFRFQKPLQFDPKGIWIRAHNVYLDLILAVGIPAACSVFFAMLLIFTVQIRRIFVTKSKTLVYAGFLTLVVVAIHSVFDFGIQSGGNALTFAAILGVSVSQQKTPVKLVQ